MTLSFFYYNAGSDEDNDKNRATKGSLDFTMDSTGELHGIVALHKSVKSDSWDHRYDAKITCKEEDEHGKRATVDFELTNIEELEIFCYDDVQGTIKRIAARQAVCYMPESFGSSIKDHQRDYGQSIQFGNAEETQLILDKYHQEPFLWFQLCNHKNLPKVVSSMIREFASNKTPTHFLL